MDFDFHREGQAVGVLPKSIEVIFELRLPLGPTPQSEQDCEHCAHRDGSAVLSKYLSHSPFPPAVSRTRSHELPVQMVLLLIASPVSDRN